MMNSFPVRIYAADVSPLEDETLFLEAYQRVTKERKKKTDRIRSARDKRLSLGAELLLLHGLSGLGFLPEERLSGNGLKFRCGENGKPYLDGTEEIFFNISHSGETAVCALAPCEVGCDVEKIRKRSLTVARRFFAREEYEAISSIEDEEARQRMFFRFWTLKESFLKASGEGLRLGLDRFQIVLGEEKISVIQNVDQRAYYFREYEAGKDCCCAVCAVWDEFEEQVRRVNIQNLLV